ncbi:hypothetical protein F0562_022155 [Nyssa sinensis]|uniref:Stress-response A/B barrel domain-containing protein n=1 Tax=Nyssa sinensis TaxID=561372 RepID=A0A5J5BMT9_9ASTE|nr:hypothetical protein F0562_022155 [Nyssa sinensis]
MAEVKHLVLIKFKEGVMAEEIVKMMEKLANEIEFIKSFEWGQDSGSLEMLKQGFTHVFLMTFKNQSDYDAFHSHPKNVEFYPTFTAAVEKMLLFDYAPVVAK